MRQGVNTLPVENLYWHGCKRHCRLPATNKKYWVDKIERNKKRSKKVNRHYRKIGWKVIRVWEHEIKQNQPIVIKEVISRIVRS